LGSLFFTALFLSVTLLGCARPAVAINLPPDDGSPGRKLYVAKCAKCHKFYDPAKYSDPEWQKWMVKMSKKSKLTPEQSEMLSQYIDQTLRQGRKANAPTNSTRP
jgi:hypothetical protein